MKNQLLRRPVYLLLALSLAACEGGGITGTGFKDQAVGVITGFGSVLVNGIKFETNNTKITMDDVENALETELKVGMVVSIQGEIDENGLAGFASRITYSDDVEGTVLANNYLTDGTINILGQTVHIAADTTFANTEVTSAITIFEEIQQGNVVEVSGFNSGDGNIYATRVEVKKLVHTSGETIEVTGTIKNLNASTFQIGEMTVAYSGAELKDIPNNTLVDGLLVEVKSTAGVVENQLVASKVELEGDGKKKYTFENNQEIELEGVVSDYSDANSSFVLNGQTVLIDADTIFKPLDGVIRNGVKLSVHGTIDANDNLIAEEIEIRYEANLRISAYVEKVILESGFKLLGKSFYVTSTSVFSDERDEGSHEPVRNMNLDHLNANDYVEISAYYDPTEEIWVATRVERDDPEDAETGATNGQFVSIRGQVSENLIDSNIASIIISGFTIDVSGIIDTAADFQVDEEVEIEGYYDPETGVIIAASGH